MFIKLWDSQQWKSKRTRQRVTDQDMQNQLRLSLHAVDMLIPTPSSNSTPSDWILQTTEDGSEQYYYNPNTQEMRYSMPPEGLMEEKIKHALANSSENSLQDSFYTALKNVDEPPVRPERAANRVITEDVGHDYRLDSPMRAASTIPLQQQQQQHEEEEEYEDDDKVIGILI